jgi:CheY-like chemotaxis protein
MTSILVLEDEPFLMTFLRQLLEQYTVLEASTAEEALRRFMDNKPSVGLLIADVNLATSSGIQVALLLRQENPALPVILTSGYPVSNWSGRDAADLARLGPSTVTILQKPFTSQTALERVRELVGEPQPEIASVESSIPVALHPRASRTPTATVGQLPAWFTCSSEDES